MSVKPEKKKKKKKCSDSLRFYLTAFFILLASFSSLGFVFMVPFVIDPGFSTIFAEFNEEPSTCVTVDIVSKFGLSNCSATFPSCREGCTREVYNCSQIFVNYFRDTEGIFKGKNFTNFEDFDNITWDYTYATIFPNIKGCGYPPKLNCTIFNKRYGENGSIFPCYYSSLQPNVTITELNLEETKETLIYAIVVPWSCFIASVLYLLVTYVGMKKPEPEYEDEQEEDRSKASKEASNYSLRSISKTINHGVSRLRGDPNDKGETEPEEKKDTSPLILDSRVLLGPPSAEQSVLRRNTLPPINPPPASPSEPER
ncbi:UNVERIFIED_CONTAM: hypothetical protein RMT77_009910 [Armadillidium vulgare]